MTKKIKSGIKGCHRKLLKNKLRKDTMKIVIVFIMLVVA